MDTMDIGEVPGSLVQPGKSIFGRNNQLIGRFGNISGHAKNPRGFSPSAIISFFPCERLGTHPSETSVSMTFKESGPFAKSNR
jgi:hypothetical protein